eukprot:CAMPEP_0183326746 /NCGR_PEP_ID=MMETSP0160_2-20130417/83021_1 /TAXON_ID=2839 ORGANISM="Odontella Sinensis, Strain Grunow 1884" /NCGR_SAMPLE_ID=MMETSP0160_2 /ASSEMBLY_ACC=CAM_ASM_000250 /LENGTH=454 /DNA_ID=CAMNT_0025494797 /DNA_START=44 /DNA_END=1405 /DNA_ORIENTATION=+
MLKNEGARRPLANAMVYHFLLSSLSSTLINLMLLLGIIGRVSEFHAGVSAATTEIPEMPRRPPRLLRGGKGLNGLRLSMEEEHFLPRASFWEKDSSISAYLIEAKSAAMDDETMFYARMMEDMASTSLNTRNEHTPIEEEAVVPAEDLYCGRSKEKYWNAMKAEVQDLVGITGLDDLQSPQSRALYWITHLDLMQICPEDPSVVQRYVMAVFYYATGGDEWRQCYSPADLHDTVLVQETNSNCSIDTDGPGTGGTDAWLTQVSECEWGGLVCHDSGELKGHLDRIDFERNNLKGTIPTEIGLLSHLRFLHLEVGELRGTIPTELGALSSLLHIDFNYNELTGMLPDELYELRSLTQLDLNDNFLGGTISESIGQLTNLTFLQLHRNEFMGNIPSQLGLLKALVVANMESNSLEGSVPSEICANRNDSGGSLVGLTVDCSNGRVSCDCCTGCGTA